jgi:hypothetical protein
MVIDEYDTYFIYIFFFFINKWLTFVVNYIYLPIF